jgi:hypothetical protein
MPVLVGGQWLNEAPAFLRRLAFALLVPDLKALFSPLIPQLEDPLAVSELLTAARIRIPDLSESERAFGLDNHSLLPQLSSSPRLSLDTL